MNNDEGRRLLELRHALGLTQKAFGEKIHLTKGYLTSLEKGRYPLNERIIKLISDTYIVNPLWLKTGAGEMFLDPQNAHITEITRIFNQLNPHFQNFIIAQLKQLLEMNHNYYPDKPGDAAK